jgi:hypothetical protein
MKVPIPVLENESTRQKWWVDMLKMMRIPVKSDESTYMFTLIIDLLRGMWVAIKGGEKPVKGNESLRNVMRKPVKGDESKC